MHATQHRLGSNAAAWSAVPRTVERDVQLVLVSGPAAPSDAPDDRWFRALARRWPSAVRVYCGGGVPGAGPIADGGYVVTAIRFAHTRVRAEWVQVRAARGHAAPALDAGMRLAARLAAPDLRHILLFADDLQVDGRAVARGVGLPLPSDVTLSSGLAGGCDRTMAVAIGLDGAPEPGGVVAIGFYGDRLVVGAGALGGWEASGVAMTAFAACSSACARPDAAAPPADVNGPMVDGRRATASDGDASDAAGTVGLPHTRLDFDLAVVRDALGAARRVSHSR